VFPSIFTDELGLDIAEALPVIKSWGLEAVDLRGRVFGKAAEALSPQQLKDLKRLLDDHGMSVGCLQSSLAKVHLPDADRRKAEQGKLEGIIRLAEATGCRLVRSFHYWQPPKEERGQLAVRPDELQKVLDRFGPLAERAREAGLRLAFENCGVTPDEVLAVVDALGEPTWGLAWDIHNDWGSDERQADADAYLQRLASRSLLLHVKARGAIEGPGDGVIPYDRVLEICQDLGVPGPVSVETHNPDPSVSHEEMSRRVVDVVQRAWPTAAPGSVEPTPKYEDATRSWDDNPVGFVVVGLGKGRDNSRKCILTPGTKLVGVCDLSEDRARRTGEEFGVPWSTDLRTWLDCDDVEVIYITTATGIHAPIACDALRAGKHVLVTKPMEASIAACEEMIRLADERGLLLGVDFERRFTPETCALRQAVRSGRFGRLLSGNVSLKVQRTADYFASGGGWRGTWKLDGGGVFSNQAIHHIDEIAFAVGIPSRIRADIWTQTHDIEAEDCGSAVWLYDDGLVITFNATTSYPQSTWYDRVELEGTEGAYARGQGGPFQTTLSRWYVDGAWRDATPEPVEPEWLGAPDNFAAALRSDAPLTADGREGRRSQAILDAMYRSARDNGGGWVDVHAEMD
jgi:predicted dehydrogenase/sugar phosphate isomerase/epimerase